MAQRRTNTVARSSMSKFLSSETAIGALEAVDIEEASDALGLEKKEPKIRTIHTRIETGKGREVSEVAAVRKPTRLRVKEAARQDEISSLAVVSRERKREVGFSSKTNAVIEQLVREYSLATGSAITVSHVIRAILLNVEYALPEVVEEIKTIGPLKRPGNEKKYEAQREKFERRLGAAVFDGIRRAPEIILD